MPLRIAVVPASTKAGRETIRQLLEAESKPFVRGIYRDPSKAPSEFAQNPNFKAVKGDVGAGAGFDFSGADAVFYIPPPTYDDGTDQGEWATRCAENVKRGIHDAASVKRLLLFSALGAQHDHSIGILRLNHISDAILKDAAQEVIMVRPGFFHEEFAHALEEARADPPAFHSWITPIDHKIPMVSLKDIAKVCANALLLGSGKPSPHVLKLFGPRHYSALDIKDGVEQATGRKVELKSVERDQLAGFFGQQIPQAHVQDFVDMVTAVLPGGIIDGDLEDDDSTVRGDTELVDTLRELAAKY